MNTSHEVSCPHSLYSIGAGSAYYKVLRQAQTGPTIQGPQDQAFSLKLKSTHCIFLARSALKAFWDHPKAQLPEASVKHSHPHPG